ncbi:MAG: hypothetical protein ACQEXG_05135 [Pseudomonadota bacterium]
MRVIARHFKGIRPVLRGIVRVVSVLIVVLALLLAGPLWMLATDSVDGAGHWSTADRSVAGLATSSRGREVAGTGLEPMTFPRL